MKREKVYLVGTHRYSFKAGIPGEIVGVEMITPEENSDPRLCYHVVWDDLIEDFVHIQNGNYKIITFTDIINGKIAPISD